MKVKEGKKGDNCTCWFAFNCRHVVSDREIWWDTLYSVHFTLLENLTFLNSIFSLNEVFKNCYGTS